MHVQQLRIVINSTETEQNKMSLKNIQNQTSKINKLNSKNQKLIAKQVTNNTSIVNNTISLFSKVKAICDTKRVDSKPNIDIITEDHVSTAEAIKDEFNNEKTERIKKSLEAVLTIISGEKRKYKNLLCALICLFVMGDVDEKYLDLSSNERKVLDAIVFRKFKKKLNPK